jgi:hypothetical protein
MRHSHSHDAIEFYSDSIMRRETRRCLWVLCAFMASFTATFWVITQ